MNSDSNISTQSQRPAHRVEFANALRGVAALSVVVSHYLGVYWSLRDVVSQLTNMPALPAEIGTPDYVRVLSSIPHFQWGPFGVAIFFLISGFVIPFSLENSSRYQFLISRFCRVYPTYWAGFTLTVIAIGLSGAAFGNSFRYNLSDVGIQYFPGLRNLMWSPGIDGVAWTLEIEVSFYLICAILLHWINGARFWLYLFPFGLFVISSLISHELAPYGSATQPLATHLYGFCLNSSYLIYMFCGLVINLTYRDKIGKMLSVFLALTYFILTAVSFHVSLFSDPSLPSSYFAALCLFVLCMKFPALVTRIPLIGFMSSISFPLYVVHGVAGYVLLGVLLRAGIPPLVSICLVFAAACAAAMIIHTLVETPSQRLGRRLARRTRAIEAEPVLGTPKCPSDKGTWG